jgi:histidine triad (HIT) family protein
MEGCLFCRIVSGEIPSNKVYEDDQVYAFYDVAPQAPVHFLVVPKKHIASLSEATEEDQALLGHILLVIKDIAAELGLDDGYRVVANTGSDGGQTVMHLHFHVLGKRSLIWPPG